MDQDVLLFIFELACGLLGGLMLSFYVQLFRLKLHYHRDQPQLPTVEMTGNWPWLLSRKPPEPSNATIYGEVSVLSGIVLGVTALSLVPGFLILLRLNIEDVPLFLGTLWLAMGAGSGLGTLFKRAGEMRLIEIRRARFLDIVPGLMTPDSVVMSSSRQASPFLRPFEENPPPPEATPQ